MKLVFVLCLILSFSANFPLGSAQDTRPQAVLDTSGRALRRGVNYYIQPASPNDGGGLTLASGRNGSSCPFEIVQALNKGAKGLLLHFSPVNDDDIVRVNTDHNIRFVNFSGSDQCPQSNVWKLDATGESPPLFITTGGVEGNPGRDTLPNWFKIQKFEDSYKIESCPSIPCQPCRVLCGDIGIFDDNGTRRLAINQPPFKVVFRRP